jgi:hypothetical protein
MSLTVLKLSRQGWFSPTPPERMTVVLHRYGQPCAIVYSSKDLVSLPKASFGRIEVQLPVWIGQGEGEVPRVGTEPHPDNHVDAIVKVAAMMRPHLNDKGTLWLWPVESTLSMGTHGQPPVEVLSRARHANRPRTKYNRNLSPNFDTLGVLGEMAFAREFGGRLCVNEAEGERSDPGFDFATRAGTVNVKGTPGASSQYLLLQASRKQHADIQVLAFTNASLTAATLVGWEYTNDIVGKEQFDAGHGEPAWSRHISKLRPIQALKVAAGIRWTPTEPVGIVSGVLDRMVKAGWTVWGSNFSDPRPLQIGVPRVYVFSPR